MVEKYYSEQAADIYCGHVLNILKSLDDESVQMALTSPPYWGLRNYAGGTDIVWGGDENCKHEWVGREFKQHSGRGDAQKSAKYSEQEPIQDMILHDNTCSLCGAWRGQLGLEPTPELYVEHLMMIFREVKRVLRRDGSFYLNIGDTYAGGSGHSMDGKWPSLDNNLKPMDSARPQRNIGIPPKCMVCIPERVMFAMIEDGWILRNKIIWHKPNAMPSSVKDRFTTTWEYMYFFTKARKYYFDLDAVRVPHKTQSLERYMSALKRGEGGEGKIEEGIGTIQHREGMDGIVAVPKDVVDLFGHGPQPQSFNLRVRDVKRGKGGATAQGGELKASEKEVEEYKYPERQKHEDADLGAQQPARKRHSGYFGEDGQPLVDFAKGKNPGDVIQATSVRHKSWMSTPGHPYTHKATGKPQNPGDYWEITTQPYKGAHFAVFPEKLCETPIKASSKIGDIVLDFMAGSGTVAVAAKKLGRRTILIDCVEEYCAISKERIKKVEYQPEML